MRPAVLLFAIAITVASAVTIGVTAIFTESAGISANTFETDTLDPPGGLTSDGTTTAILNWTATADTYASGYLVLRSDTDGGPYSQVGDVSPRSTTTFSESPAPGTYYYVVRSYAQNWESANSAQVTAIVTP